MKDAKLNKHVESVKAKNAQRIAKTGEQLATLATSNNIINTLAKNLCNNVLSLGVNNLTTVNSCYALASAIVHARIKRINGVSKNGADNRFKLQNVALKNDVSRMFNGKHSTTRFQLAVEQLEKLYTTVTLTTGDQAGEQVTKCTDKKLAAEIMGQLADLTANGDGMDIVHDVVCVIWQTVNGALFNGTLTETTLLENRKKLITRSCFYHNGEKKPSELWQYTTTNTVKECSLTVSQYINRMAARQNYECAYTELSYSLETEDGETGEKETVEVIRYNPVAEIALSGSADNITVNNAVSEMAEAIATNANFTARQLFIFKNVLCGRMEQKQVADKFGIDERNVKRQVAETIRKCFEALTDEQKELAKSFGYSAEAVADKTATAKTVEAKDENGVVVGLFPSVAKCADVLGVSRGSVQDVLSGRRKAVKGYIIRYI